MEDKSYKGPKCTTADRLFSKQKVPWSCQLSHLSKSIRLLFLRKAVAVYNICRLVSA